MDYDVQVEETIAYWMEEEVEGNAPADAATTVEVVAGDDLPF